MRQATTTFFSITSVMLFAFLGSEVASRSLIDTGNPHQLDMTAPDLWPTQPVRVDVAAQDYERVQPDGTRIAGRGARLANPASYVEVQAVFDNSRFNG